jgi:hypothetical protein
MMNSHLITNPRPTKSATISARMTSNTSDMAASFPLPPEPKHVTPASRSP